MSIGVHGIKKKLSGSLHALIFRYTEHSDGVCTIRVYYYFDIASSFFAYVGCIYVEKQWVWVKVSNKLCVQKMISESPDLDATINNHIWMWFVTISLE